MSLDNLKNAAEAFNWLQLDPEKKGRQVLTACPICKPDDQADDGARVAHAMTTAALAYCYLYDYTCDPAEPNEATFRQALHKYLPLVRFVALLHTEEKLLEAALAKNFHQDKELGLWLLEQLQSKTTIATDSLEAEDSTGLTPDLAEILRQALQMAHVVAGAQSKEAESKPEFKEAFNEGLYAKMQSTKIGLVLGGATKIKEYVFESAKLPEIRGASSLLDYINLQLTPALFNYPKDEEKDIDYPKDLARLKKYDHLKPQIESLALVPECLIYANGGEFLAFTPFSQANQVAFVLEQIYAIETLTAQAVAVGDTFSLLELRFGVKPQDYWREDFEKDKTLAGVQASLIVDRDESQSLEDAFLAAKTFGEVVKYLTAQRYRRRDFNLTNIYGEDVPPRQLASFDTFPLGRRCDSCDRRLAVVQKPIESNDPNPDWLCEPCARKAVVGQMQRGKSNSDKWFKNKGFEWEAPKEELQSWKQRFENFLNNNPTYREFYLKDITQAIRMADDVHEISEATFELGAMSGFLGVVYGDGNNMGGILQTIDTPAKYRSFANNVFKVLLESVQQTLAEKLQPVKVSSKEDPQRSELCHPFEVLSVGGDDLYLFVPAPVALEVALHIGKLVESKLSTLAQFNAGKTYEPTRVQRVALSPKELSSEQAKAKKQSKVSLSTGVLLAPESTPIFFMNDLVEQLLKSAKKKAASLRRDKFGGTEKKFYGGTIDFMALKAVTMISGKVEDWRRGALEHHFGNQTLRLTSKPYTNLELAKLLATLRTLKDKEGQGPAKSQLYQLQEQLSGGELSSSINYLYLIARSKKQQGLQLQTEINRWLLDGSAKAPWRKVELTDEEERKNALKGKKDKVVLETILADLMELYDFAPGQSGRDTNANGGAE
jgi:CRISPR-associated protein Cmr2